MIAIKRKQLQSILIETPAGPILIKLLNVSYTETRIGVTSPKHFRIRRGELCDPAEIAALDGEANGGPKS